MRIGAIYVFLEDRRLTWLQLALITLWSTFYNDLRKIVLYRASSGPDEWFWLYKTYIFCLIVYIYIYVIAN